MKIHLIRHGKTKANEKHLYCGSSDLQLSFQGIKELKQLRKEVHYPTANLYITSGMKRTNKTLRVLYKQKPELKIESFKEMNFGDFELKHHTNLEQLNSYQQWITNIDTVSCPNGESKSQFEKRVLEGLKQLCAFQKDTVLIAHSGVIGVIMQHLFPNEKDFYSWQPDFGRGYSVDLDENKYDKI